MNTSDKAMLNNANPGTIPAGFLGAALDSIEDPLFLIQDNAEIRYVNHSACEVLGYSADELLSMSLPDIDSFFPDQSCLSYWDLLREKGQILSGTRYQKKDGALISIEYKINHFVFSDVDHYLVIASSIDLNNKTDHHQKWLREHFSDVLLSSADWLWEVDQKGRYTYVSPRVQDFLGYEVCEIIGKTPFDFMPDNEAIRIGEIFKRIIQEKGIITDLENWNIHKDGSKVCLQTNGIPIIDSKGELLGYRGIDKDITKKIQAEQAINNERSLLRGLIDTIPDPVYIKNNEGAFLYVNEAFSTFVNKPVSEIIGRQTWNVCDYSSEGCFCTTGSTLYNSEMAEQSAQWIQCPDRDRALLDIIKTSCFSSNGDLLGIIGISHDITKYKEREEELRLSEERLLLAQSIAQTGNWDWDINKGTLFWSDEIYRIFELDPQQNPASYENFLNSIHSNDREYVKLNIQRAVENHGIYEVDHRIVCPDGRTKVVHEQGSVFYNDAGTAVTMSGTIQDITEQHHTKQQLKKSLRYEEALAACSSDLLSDKDDLVSTALQHLRDASGSNRIYIFKNFDDPEHGPSASYEYEACAKGVSSYLHHEDYKTFHYSDGAIYKRLITRKCCTFKLDALCEWEQKILQGQGVLAILLIPIIVQDVWYGFIGIDETSAGNEWGSDEVLLLSTAADMFSSYFLRLDTRNSLLAGYDALELRAEESKQNIDLLGKNLLIEISNQKQKEGELRESQDRFNLLANNTTEGFFIAPADGSSLIYANPALLNILEAASIEGTRDLMDYLDKILPEDRLIIEKLMTEGFTEPTRIEFRMMRNDGNVCWLKAQLSPVFDTKRQLQRIVGIIEDVTELKQLEIDRLEEAHKQRTTLIREVHHRIKNHLQGITGLLTVEAFRQPEIKKYLDKATGQINAIATIHGLQGEDPTENVNLLTVLKSIIRSLEELHLSNIQLSNKLPAEIACLCLDQNEAVPISLILNELLQNAIKHSIVDLNEFTVQIEISKAGDLIKIEITNPVKNISSLEHIETDSEAGNGLSLVRSMMPTEGATLSITQDEETFTARLEIKEPVIEYDNCGTVR